MEQDLREMFRKYRENKKYQLTTGHEERFLNKLEEALPRKKKSKYILLKIAASVLVIVSMGLGYLHFNESNHTNATVVNSDTTNRKQPHFSFGDLSPDLKKVENYYLANINLELSKLEVSPETKDLVDSFMEQLNNLNEEYNSLNSELKELGPNDQTITALIENLQLRLQLLKKLKKKLNELKASKNEQIKKNTI
ncbi:hypothetical protein ACNR9Q_08775 [Maribacter sp. X9]|uniref:hypothetical protein n=1 Tax=Maribacter sp. X9 TaxID=3402159 RepID=UPI003AF36566